MRTFRSERKETDGRESDVVGSMAPPSCPDPEQDLPEAMEFLLRRKPQTMPARTARFDPIVRMGIRAYTQAVTRAAFSASA
jgi:hypothetical protein